MIGDITIFVAFTAGIVSFLAPCVLPIIPGFLAYLAGGAGETQPSRREVFINAVFFVLGFSLVFAALGVLLNTVLESVAYSVQIWLSRVGGALIIFFGLYLVGLIRISFLEREYKLAVVHRFSSRYFTSFVFGLAFAAGWTPCVGAVLGAVLGLAATAPGSAFALLLAYALGLGIPFLVVGLFAGEVQQWLNRLGTIARYINIIFGVLLIGLGILVFTGELARIANFEFLNSFLLSS
jgi:cytochrome c-type biogenesis protein